MLYKKKVEIYEKIRANSKIVKKNQHLIENSELLKGKKEEDFNSEEEDIANK